MDTAELSSCPYCGGIFNKRLYSIAETAHLLGVPASTVRHWIRRGLLANRFWPKSIGCLKRVVDSKDLETFIEEFFPRSETITPDSPSPRARQIWKMIEWHRANGRKGKAVQMANKKARESKDATDNQEGTTWPLRVTRGTA